VSEISNPYIAGAPVVESSMFFGREDVFKWIERSLAGKFVNHILVLHGQRRVGKTSVLKQIPNFLPRNYIQVFYDLQGRTSTSLDRFLWWLASEITRTLKKEHDINIPRPDRKAFEDTEYLISEFLPSLRPLLEDQVLILTFDEFDTLDRPEIQESLARPLIAYLRRLMEVEGLTFIFSIGSSGDKLENMQASYTDFFKSALYRKISFLTSEDCYRLITKPVEGIIEYERKAVERIVEITSGHPYFTQLMCHELFALCQKTGARTICAADVESILGDVIERGTVNLKFVWDEASDLEKWILAGLAQLEPGASTHKLGQLLLKQRVRFSDADLNAAVLHLLDKDVITQDNRFVIYLMQMWLQTNRPLDRVREELAEVNPIANRYIEIGDEYRDRGQGSQAIESYKQALQADPGNLRAQFSIGSVHLDAKAYSEAAAAFELALQIDDEDVGARTGYCCAILALGDAARDEGQEETAAGFYDKILLVNPAHIDARLRLAEIYREHAEKYLSAGQDDAALSAYNQAMDYAPEDETLAKRYDDVLAQKKAKVTAEWLGKAERALSRQRWDEASGFVEEALKLDPANAELQAKLVKTKDAPRQFKINGYRQEAEKAIKQGNFEKAVSVIETALLLSPGDESLADWLETARSDRLSAQLNLYDEQVNRALSSGDWDTAIQLTGQASEIAPDDRAWKEKIAEIEAARHQAQLNDLRWEADTARAAGRWDEAAAALEQIRKLKPEKLEIEAEIESIRQEKRQSQLLEFKTQAEKAAKAEKWKDAEQAWKAYLALKPEDSTEAEADLQKAARYSKISANYTEAQNAIRKKRYGRAIELLQDIIAQEPAYKSTSRLLVEAVEANKATPVWHKPGLYGVVGVVLILMIGIFLGPRIWKSISTAWQRTPTMTETHDDPTENPSTPTTEVVILPTTTETLPSETIKPTQEIVFTPTSTITVLPTLINTSTPKPEKLHYTKKIMQGPITDLAWDTETGYLLGVASREKDTAILNGNTGGKFSQIPSNLHQSAVLSNAWELKGGGGAYATGDVNGLVIFYRHVQTGAMDGPFTIDTLLGSGEITDLSYGNVSGISLAASTSSGYIASWDTLGNQGYVIWKKQVDTGPVFSVDWNLTNHQILTVSENEGVQVWNALTGSRLQRLKVQSRSAAWSPDGKYIVLEDHSSGTSVLEVFQSGGSKARVELAALVNKVAWSPDGTIIASADQDGVIRLWSAIGSNGQVGSLEELYAFTQNAEITSLIFSPDGSLIVAGDVNGYIWAWTLKGE